MAHCREGGGGGDYQQAEKEEEETFPSIKEDYTKVHQEMVYFSSVFEEGLSIDFPQDVETVQLQFQ